MYQSSPFISVAEETGDHNTFTPSVDTSEDSLEMISYTQTRNNKIKNLALLGMSSGPTPNEAEVARHSSHKHKAHKHQKQNKKGKNKSNNDTDIIDNKECERSITMKNKEKKTNHCSADLIDTKNNLSESTHISFANDNKPQLETSKSSKEGSLEITETEQTIIIPNKQRNVPVDFQNHRIKKSNSIKASKLPPLNGYSTQRIKIKIQNKKQINLFENVTISQNEENNDRNNCNHNTENIVLRTENPRKLYQKAGNDLQSNEISRSESTSSYPVTLNLHKTQSMMIPCKVDRYGWQMTDDRPPATPKEIEKEKIESQIEFNREKKWLKMINKWNFYITHKKDKVKKRIKKGIPNSMRSRVWQLLLDPEASNGSQEASSRPSLNYYILQGRNKCCNTIEVDLRRTLPRVPRFSDTNVLDSLRNVLHAYSNKDSEIGYYQGMAFFAAFLLSYLDEVDAFWCFDNLMNGPKLQYRRLFIHKFSGLDQMNALWEVLLKTKYPKVFHHFEKIELMSIIYTPSWFFSAFLNAPFEPVLLLRIFDRLLMFGMRTLLSFGLTIVAMNKKFLENANFDRIVPYLQYPYLSDTFKDWRVVMEKFDEHWLSQSDYNKLFKLVKFPPFF